MASIGKQDSGKAELENRTVDTMVGDGSATTLVLSSAPISINNVLIFISGIMQRPTTDYTLSGSTITFSEAPIAGLKVVAITGGGEHIGIPLTKLGTDKFMESAVTDAKIATGISASKLTGALPALDGSAVTGASGANVSGVDTVSANDPTITTNPASAGHIWLNRTSAEMFVCTDNTAGANVWTNVGLGTGAVPIAQYMSATGGTITIDGDYKVHTFTGSGFFTPLIGVDGSVGNKVEYLNIAGGGGGGAAGGGGGAGGYRADTNVTVVNARYVITVGAGGIGAVGYDPPYTYWANYGHDTVINNLGITSIGGGYGLSYAQPDTDPYAFAQPVGGSGGGGALQAAPQGTGRIGTPGQGNAGGNGAQTTGTNRHGGGGGGAGSVGGNSSSPSTGGTGGAGLASDIVETGVNVFRAGGGGGGADNRTAGGALGVGGTGGGGDGRYSRDNAEAGDTNTGSGGGGSGYENVTPYVGNGGNGGSGVVIFRYRFQ